MNKALVVALLATAVATAGAQDWKSVEAAMGRAGVAQPGDVYRFNFPRSDMRVTASGVAIKPAFALGSWVAFKRVPGAIHGDVAMAMGDLVLTDRELAPVLLRLQQGGVQQTAIHHHLIRESPRVLYVHVHAMDDPVKIAQTIRSALALTKTPPASNASALTPKVELDTAAVAQALGRSGRVNGGVYQVSVPRAEQVKDGGMDVPPSMGLATAINFQPTGAGKAAITGDFVMIATEVNQVIRVLRENGIETVSLHNHLLEEQPRLFFMHFWANDNAVKLAGALRLALDKMNVAR